MKKRIFVAMILSAVMLLAFCACSSDKDTNSTQNAETSTSQASKDNSKSEDTLKFSVEDLEGNKVTESIFSDSKLTVINVWGTFCSPCIEEMPDLAEISQQYKEKGVTFYGIVIDATDTTGEVIDSQLDEARRIVKETKSTYSHLIPTGELFSYTSTITAVPTTLFFDSKGNLLNSVLGSRSKESWGTLVNSMLEEVSK